MAFTGVLKTVVAGKGYGYIQSTGFAGDVFVHFSGFVNGCADDMVVGLKMDFDLEINERNGKVKACNVVLKQSVRPSAVFDLGRCLLRIECLLEKILAKESGLWHRRLDEIWNCGKSSSGVPRMTSRTTWEPNEFEANLVGKWETLPYEADSTVETDRADDSKDAGTGDDVVENGPVSSHIEEDHSGSQGGDADERAASAGSEDGIPWHKDDEFKRRMLEMGTTLKTISENLRSPLE